MNDFLRPSNLYVDTRGVDMHGNGYAFEVIISVEGVRVIARVGEGGKTNSVCEGVAGIAEGRCFGVLGGVDLTHARRWAGGVSGLRLSVRARG